MVISQVKTQHFNWQIDAVDMLGKGPECKHALCCDIAESWFNLGIRNEGLLAYNNVNKYN